MPTVAQEHVERGTCEGALDIQRQLIADYREDIRKYAEGMDQSRILKPKIWEGTISTRLVQPVERWPHGYRCRDTGSMRPAFCCFGTDALKTLSKTGLADGFAVNIVRTCFCSACALYSKSS
jgi:hypothetical protein